MKYSNESLKLLEKPLDKLCYTVFDIEATGIKPENGDKILEIGAVKIEENFKISFSKLHSLVKPDISIPEKSTLIHGINNSDVENAPDLCQVLYDFIDFSRGSILVAHHAAKDMSFLKHSMGEYFMESPFELVIDTLRMSKVMYPEMKKHSLDCIADRMNLSIKSKYKRHRAIYDAELTALAFKSMIKRLFLSECYNLFDLQEYLYDWH